MNNVIQTAGAYAGLLALVIAVVLTMLVFSVARDVRRLREWAGGAPERDADVKELSEAVARERAEELQVIAERERRREIREGGIEAGFWQRLGRAGRVMTVLAAVLILGAGGAWAGVSLFGGDDSGSNGQPAGKGAGQNQKQQGAPSAPKPANIKVAVLNATDGTEAGLAAEYGDRLNSGGFAVGTVANASETFETSTVMYLKGNEKAARRVAQAIGIDQVELMTSGIAAAAPDAIVVVVIGVDHTALPTG